MWFRFLVSACLFAPFAMGARILGVFMTPSYSHQIMYQPVWRELSLRGHQVTVYTPCPLNDSTLTNLTEFDLSFSFSYLDNVGEGGYEYSKLFETFFNTSEVQLNHKFLKDLIKNANNDTYDLLLVEYLWPSYYALKELYQVPMVGMVSLPMTITSLNALGMDRHPVVEPEFLMGFETAENFLQRVKSFLFSWTIKLLVPIKMASVLNEQVARHFGLVGKSVTQLTNEVSLVLANYNFANQKPHPMTPQYIPISAIHVKPQQPLPQDLQEILDQSEGVIYYSMGTNVDPSKVSKEMLHTFFNVLGKLPYTVLFKYANESSLENIPKNFLVRKWFPQQDVLGHPKVKLFIMQGGIQSIDEAISRKVPLLIVPVFGDQKQNTARSLKLGIAETIDYHSFTEQELEEKISKLLTENSYRENLEKQWRIIQDQPMSPVDTATFWIEYVLRHKGAHHLKYEAINLPVYQNYFLDVLAFLALVLAGLVYVCKKIVIISLQRVKNLVGTRGKSKVS